MLHTEYDENFIINNNYNIITGRRKRQEANTRSPQTFNTLTTSMQKNAWKTKPFHR